MSDQKKETPPTVITLTLLIQRGNLVVSCVDNHEARQAIHRVNGIVLGGGNHHQNL